MGVSTNAYLFFGIHFGEDDEYEWPWMKGPDGDPDGDNEENPWGGEWEKYYAEKMGCPPPNVPYEGNKDVFSQYWDKVRELDESSGCTVDIHCSDGCPMYFVALSGYDSAWRGSPCEIDPDKLKITQDDIDKLKAFCDLMEIEWSEPKWYLASYWG